MKSIFFAPAALLLTASLAVAQDAQPAPKPAAVPAKNKPSTVQAAKPADKPQDMLEISQVFGIKQIDPATYEIDARMQNGEPLKIRTNAFVLQSLGKMLGTYGR